MTAREIIELLGLEPLPQEGGYYSETYRSPEHVHSDALHSRYGSKRRHATAIYYLLTPDTFSALHRVKSDEIFHFYLGDPVEMLQLTPEGKGTTTIIGADLASGQRPQVVVPNGVWQGGRLLPGGKFALMGCTVAPGFEFTDYEHGDRAGLVGEYPQFKAEILELT